MSLDIALSKNLGCFSFAISLLLGCLTNSISTILFVSMCSFQGTMDSKIFRFVVPDSFRKSNGDKGIRTLDPLLARQVLSQLSYTPNYVFVGYYYRMGLSGLEPPTSRLSGVRSNRLSYRPPVAWASSKHCLRPAIGFALGV